MIQSAKWLLGATLTLTSALHAQNEIPALVEKPSLRARESKIVRVRNVSVEIIAHWLEPSRHAPSMMDKNSITAWVNSGHDEKDAPRLHPPVPIVLPPSVSIREVSKGNNAVFITGKAEEVEQAEKLIRELDQYLRQIEIECQVIGVDTAALKAAKLPWTPAGKTFSGAPLQQAKINGHSQLINAWSKNRQSEAITSPRIIAMNGSVADLRSETITTGGLTYFLGTRQEPIDARNTQISRLPSFTESLGMTAWPQIQSDGSITAGIQISRNLSLRFQKRIPNNHADLQNAVKEGQISQKALEEFGSMQANIEQDRHFLRSAEGFEREINMHSGDTLAFSGFKAEEFLGSAMLNGQARKLRGKTLIAFITMREIRRLSEAAVVPGT